VAYVYGHSISPGALYLGTLHWLALTSKAADRLDVEGCRGHCLKLNHPYIKEEINYISKYNNIAKGREYSRVGDVA
jgi:hypothetical protein